MDLLTEGLVIFDSVPSPLGYPAQIRYAGLGKGMQAGKTLFEVILEDMSYGYFLLPGKITTFEEACSRLQALADGDSQETVAESAVRYCYVHVDDNEFYGEGS